MTEVSVINDLRSMVGSAGDLVYVKYHSQPWDMGGGMFMWRTGAENPLLTNLSSYYGLDNNGTLIKATSNNTGRWVRQYDDYISLAHFGGCKDMYATTALQAAIDFASSNVTTSNSPTRGTAIFIPGGTYIINEITLKYGIQLIGNSVDQPIINATLPGEPGYSFGTGYLFNMAADVVQLEISNLNILGRNTSDKGCFYFNAQPGSASPTDDGGIWQSSFKNIKITGFKGHAIYSKGGTNGYLPNQSLVFELINVEMSPLAPYTSCALKITGQNGQLVFIDSGFNGFQDIRTNPPTYHKGHVVNISRDPLVTAAYPATISFLTSTFQNGDYGVYIDYAENITFDNCWFERLGVAVSVDGSENECRSINVLNSRFADASGYGSAPASSGNLINGGVCVNITNARATVANNYVTVTEPDDPRILNDSFLIAQGVGGVINPGVEVFGNTFVDSRLSNTSGIVQVVTSVLSNSITCGYNKFLYVNTSTSVITNINSGLLESETFYLRANGGSIKFNTGGNIYLTGRGGTTPFTLQNGQVAGFTKLGPNLYQLTSLVTYTTP